MGIRTVGVGAQGAIADDPDEEGYDEDADEKTRRQEQQLTGETGQRRQGAAEPSEHQQKDSLRCGRGAA